MTDRPPATPVPDSRPQASEVADAAAPVTPAVTLYWRPGCGFCHVLRRELDRAGVERTEVNIWEDRAAAAVVRGHARGNETVPTVVVGDLALVNPAAGEVLAVLGLAEPAAGSGAPARPGHRMTWSGVSWSVAVCAAWVALAVTNPTTTYHLAPALVVLAWPVAARAHPTPGGWFLGVVPAAGGVALAVAATVALSVREALAGPALVGPDAVSETWLVIAVASMVALWLARPWRGTGTASAADAADGGLDERRGSGPVTVVGTGGCTSGPGAQEQCPWPPAPPTR